MKAWAASLPSLTPLSSALSQLGLWLQLTPHSWFCGDGSGSADPAPVSNASPGLATWPDGPPEPLGHRGRLPSTCPYQPQPWGPRPTGELTGSRGPEAAGVEAVPGIRALPLLDSIWGRGLLGLLPCSAPLSSPCAELVVCQPWRQQQHAQPEPQLRATHPLAPGPLITPGHSHVPSR